jgi:hypothetical protein
MWHPTSLYGLRENGIIGMKQNVNHSLRCVSWVGEAGGGLNGGVTVGGV